MSKLQVITLPFFKTESGKTIPIQLSYQLFGKPLHKAPIVLVNHALTGNSNVCGKDGWWNELIGIDKTIDTNTYTILAFNIPGNGMDTVLIDDYKSFIARDIARIFLLGLKELNIEQLFAIIGGSLGGGIAWEMAVLSPKITKNLIPIAADWKSTDWIIANCQIQEQFLLHSSKPLHNARMHAMLLYRTPQSLNQRFDRTINEKLGIFNVESWLLHHGKKLQERFQLSSYKLMNQLLKTIDVTAGGKKSIEVLGSIEANIYMIGVDTDLFFTTEEDLKTLKILTLLKRNVTYKEINSIHGHDAFLIEYEQLSKILAPVLKESADSFESMSVTMSKPI